MTLRPSKFVDEHSVKCELAAEILRSTGRLRLRVTGWSMLPAVWPGDTLLIERSRMEAIANGDIVLFGRDCRLFVHRAVGRTETAESRLMTRGDAMAAGDPPVHEHELLGKISFIIRNGRLIEPAKCLQLSGRTLASLFQRSRVAARIVTSLYGMHPASHCRST